jgi:hypothetical protein
MMINRDIFLIIAKILATVSLACLIIQAIAFYSTTCYAADYINCIWRPGEKTKCKLRDVPEKRPYYMEEMSVCSDLTNKLKERSKWAWLYPTQKDLYIFAELLGCASKHKINKLLRENGYDDIDVENSSMQQKELTIRNLFKQINPGYEFTTIQVRQVYDEWGPHEEYQGNVLWFSTYWRCTKGEQAGFIGSQEFHINLDTKRWTGLDDYWDNKGQGWCTPGTKGHWAPIDMTKPWSGYPGSFPLLEIYRGFSATTE